MPGRPTARPLTDLADDDLVAMISTGSREAFEALYHRHVQHANAYARRLLRNPDRAHEVVQDAFIGVWRRCDSYHPERGAVGTWLMAIVHHRAIDTIRRDQHIAPLLHNPDEMPEQAADGCLMETTLDHETSVELRDHLIRLPERQRHILALAYFGQLSQSEIAAHLNVPLGTVKGAIRCALKRLRTQMVPAS